MMVKENKRFNYKINKYKINVEIEIKIVKWIYGFISRILFILVYWKDLVIMLFRY